MQRSSHTKSPASLAFTSLHPPICFVNYQRSFCRPLVKGINFGCWLDEVPKRSGRLLFTLWSLWWLAVMHTLFFNHVPRGPSKHGTACSQCKSMYISCFPGDGHFLVPMRSYVFSHHTCLDKYRWSIIYYRNICVIHKDIRRTGYWLFFPHLWVYWLIFPGGPPQFWPAGWGYFMFAMTQSLSATAPRNRNQEIYPSILGELSCQPYQRGDIWGWNVCRSFGVDWQGVNAGVVLDCNVS
jgi:hypothetical protein